MSAAVRERLPCRKCCPFGMYFHIIWRRAALGKHVPLWAIVRESSSIARRENVFLPPWHEVARKRGGEMREK